MRSFQVLDTVTRKNPVILRSQSYPCLKTLLCATWVIRIKLPKETVWTGNSFKIRSLLTLHIVLRHCFKGISNYSINSLLTGLWDNTASESHISASTAKSVTVPEFLLFKVTEFLKLKRLKMSLIIQLIAVDCTAEAAWEEHVQGCQCAFSETVEEHDLLLLLPDICPFK